MKARLLWCIALIYFVFITDAGMVRADDSKKSKPLIIQSYMQDRYTADTDGADGFALRRMKLLMTWTPSSQHTFFVQGIYKNGNRSSSDGRLWIQELWWKQKAGSGWFTVGQFKPHFGLERFTSDTILDTIDRAQVTDSLAPDGGLSKSFVRDVGVQYDMGRNEKSGQITFGIFGGNGSMAERYSGNGPLMALHAVKRWTVSGSSWMQFGASFSRRHDRNIDFSGALPGMSALGVKHFHGDDTRWNLEAASDLGRWKFRGEYTDARFTGSSGSRMFDAQGWYAQADCSFNCKWDGVMRYETMDAGVATSLSQNIGKMTFGTTCRLNSHAERIQLNYVLHYQNAHKESGDNLIVQYQHFFL